MLIFTLITTIIGAIIGAGFASGKEIVTFFGQFGWWSYPFMAISFLFFGFVFYVFCVVGKIVKPRSLSDITKALFSKTHVVIDILLMLSMFITLAAMLAGADGLAVSYWGLNYTFPWVSIATSIGVILILSGGKQNMYRTNRVVMPAIVVFIVIILFQFFIFAPKETVTVIDDQTLIQTLKGLSLAFLYVGLNTVSESFIIARVSENMNKKSMKIGSWATAFLVMSLVCLIYTAVINSGDMIFSSELPMVKLAYLTNSFLGNAYAVILWFAILTTLVAVTYTMTSWLKQFLPNKFICTCIITLIGFILSRLGFADIVETFYPIKGVLGLFFIIFAIIFYFKNRKKMSDI